MLELLFVAAVVAIVFLGILLLVNDGRLADYRAERDFALAQLSVEREKAHQIEMRRRQARDSRGRFLGLIEGERQ